MPGPGGCRRRRRPARCFLVGCPRSGTTLLQAFLGAHPDVQSFPESHAFRYAYKGPGLVRRFRRTRKAVAAFGREIGQADAAPRRSAPFPGWYLRRFVRLLDEVTAGNGKRLWVEKTPDHVLYIPQIRRRVPDARFLHLVRDGRAVVTSLYEVTRRHPKVWGSGWTLENCVGHWNRCLRATVAALREGGPHLVLAYEHLVADPAPALTLACRFLDLEFREEMVIRYPAAAEGFVTSTEWAWKAEVRGDIRDPGLEKYEGVFSAEERLWVEEHLDPIPQWLFAALGEGPP